MVSFGDGGVGDGRAGNKELCCVRTIQHPLPVWSHNLSLTNLLISQPILIHFRWELYQINKSHRLTPKLTSQITFPSSLRQF